MKRLIIGLIVLVGAVFGLDWILAPNYSQFDLTEEGAIEGQFIVFLKEKEKFSNQEKIYAFLERKGFRINRERVFADGIFGFSGKITKEELDRIEGWPLIRRVFSNVESYTQDFVVQTTRPRMQSDPIPQTTRPRMQADYDSLLQTSNAVKFVGGPMSVESSSKKVWVLDTGIDGDHQDLQAHLVRSGNLAKSFIPDELEPYVDLNGHGTFCAGLIGAKSTDSESEYVRMNGVAPGASLVSIKVLNGEGTGDWGTVLSGISYAIARANAGDILSISLGSKYEKACDFFNDPSFGRLRNKIRQRGIFVVMSAGNLGLDDSPASPPSSLTNFPGCMDGDNFITVGSLTFGESIRVSDFSYIGMPSIDFMAPGDRVFSTYKGNQYSLQSGTSAAAAIVSGIIYLRSSPPAGNETVRGNAPDQTQYPIAKID